MADTFLVIGTGPTVNLVLSGVGASAYAIWLEAGNAGTEQDFLDSLVGATGPTGATGPQGDPGFVSLNGLTNPTQTFATDTTGTDFAISSSGTAHTFNLPSSSASNRGLLLAMDWTTFNNKVGGSGTPNYIPKFSGAGTLGNSIVYETGSNVGIGTTTPGEKLDLDGNIILSGGSPANARKITFTGYGSPALVLYDGGITNRYGWGLNSNEMQFFMPSASSRYTWNKGGDFQPSGTNELMRLTQAGRLGINTTSPSELLDVAGNIILSGGNRTLSFSTGYGVPAVLLYDGGAGGRYGMGVNSHQVQFFVPTASGHFSFNKGGDFQSSGTNELVRITTDGRIGLSTTAPSSSIDINGANGYQQLRLRTTYTPTGSADALGNIGDTAWDANYFYIKTAAGWKRAALSTF